ncbi:hypothetical protein B296_00052125 [Ensete ventricosum]|uniref:Uncharacterized protein n=1 Tax=Ensete ventricosum TaxID=4639 RepID=A0A426YDR8_ENSVE|nr:hypothetical protein B296_00052125 [Ensete ventricosum]
MHSSLQCDAYGAPASSETTWTMRTSFPEYVVALATIVGSVLFTVWFTFIFGGVGIACLPLGLIFSFIRRPKAVITRSQYIKIHPLWVFVFVFSNQLFGCSVIQFCATAFAYYSQATAAQEIFGHTLQSLRGIKYLYK